MDGAPNGSILILHATKVDGCKLRVSPNGSNISSTTRQPPDGSTTTRQPPGGFTTTRQPSGGSSGGGGEEDICYTVLVYGIHHAAGER